MQKECNKKVKNGRAIGLTVFVTDMISTFVTFATMSHF
ncbi:hypothetical protein BACCAP_01489 [Pseudoflavonifractor capillosus ATCC 29799]|uniref:Uncharacterized protein n=1 Tax=Pseudoflavonifractor capillosus ATCC 29799 TaxID=411467 RepID=A6NTG0_9FIRM|nr:hypothetical protein BACCAP_01489 [Pseudoflavonifractor capillosus ATCC 29799]